MSSFDSLALLVGGAALTLAGIDMARSAQASIGALSASWPTDRAIWMAIVGTAAMLFGLVGTWRARRRRP